MECFAFGGATVRFASLETSFHAAHHTVHPPPSYEGPPHCPKDKNRSPFHGKKPLIVKWFLEKRLYLPKTILHGRDAILRVRIKWLIFNIILQLWAGLLGLVFRRRRVVFILLTMPPTSLERATLGLWCDWFKPLLEIRHAAALTTGAKHWHRQKAVFYVFVSAPQYLSTEPLCRTNRRKDVENLLKCCRNFSYTEYFP